MCITDRDAEAIRIVNVYAYTHESSRYVYTFLYIIRALIDGDDMRNGKRTKCVRLAELEQQSSGREVREVDRQCIRICCGYIYICTTYTCKI